MTAEGILITALLILVVLFGVEILSMPFGSESRIPLGIIFRCSLVAQVALPVALLCWLLLRHFLFPPTHTGMKPHVPDMSGLVLLFYSWIAEVCFLLTGTVRGIRMFILSQKPTQIHPNPAWQKTLRP